MLRGETFSELYDMSDPADPNIKLGIYGNRIILDQLAKKVFTFCYSPGLLAD